MPLVKKLTKIGNSWGVILPADVLKVAQMDPTTECEIRVEKEGILLKPHFKKDREDQRVMKAMARFIKKYRNDLKKLAY